MLIRCRWAFMWGTIWSYEYNEYLCLYINNILNPGGLNYEKTDLHDDGGNDGGSGPDRLLRRGKGNNGGPHRGKDSGIDNPGTCRR